MQPDPSCPPPPSSPQVSAFRHSLHKNFKLGILGINITVLSAAAYIAPFFVSFPLAPVIQIIGLTVLTFVSIGLVDKQLAYHQCKQFFVIKYSFLQQQLHKIPTALITVADAMQENWKSGMIAGVFFAIAAQATQFIAFNALSLTPLALLFVIGGAVWIQLESKKKEAQSSQKQDILEKASRHSSWSQIRAEERPAFHAVDERKRLMEALLFYSSLIFTIGCIAIRILATATTCVIIPIL